MRFFFFFFFFFSNIAKDKNSWALERMGGLACSINNLGSTKKKGPIVFYICNPIL